MARRDNGLDKRVISVGFIPQRLRRDTIYVGIKPMLSGIDIHVRSREPFKYQYDGEPVVRSTIQAQFLQYPFDYQGYLKINNFLMNLAKKNNAEIHSRAFKEIELIHKNLEKIFKKIRSR